MPQVRPFARARSRAPGPNRARGLASSLWIGAALAWVACGDGGDPNYQMPPGLALATDAQVLIDAGALPAPSGGGLVTLPDAQVAFDASSAPDAGALADAQPMASGDSSVTDAGASDAGSPDAGPPRMDLGKGSGKDVITIGDSWMLLIFTGIQESLVKASGNQPYRKYAFPGTRMLNGEIPGQYADAKRADPKIKTVVMTGGGNDIILNDQLKADCAEGGAMCQAQLEKIGKALTDLWAQMSKDGVQDVIHVMYSTSAGDGVKNGEESNKKMAEACAAVPAPLRCHLLNTDMLVTKMDLRSDNIHPTDQAYDAIGKAVFALMEKEGMRR